MAQLKESCSVCGARRELYRCGACLTSVYCGAECQARDWRAGHPAFCLIAGKRKRETTLVDFPREIVFEIARKLSQEELKRFLEGNNFFASRPSVIKYIYTHYNFGDHGYDDNAYKNNVYALDSLENLPAWVYNFRNVKYTKNNIDIILEIIRRFPFLQKIYTDNRRIDVYFIQDNQYMLDIANSLKYYAGLQWLGFDKTKLDVKMLMDAFKQNPDIYALDINMTYIGDEGARDIADMLKQNTKLKTLDLHNNNFGLNGLQLVADALKHNTTLKRLTIPEHVHTTEDVHLLIDALKHNTTLLDIEIYETEYADSEIDEYFDRAVLEELLVYLQRNNDLAGEKHKMDIEDLMYHG